MPTPKPETVPYGSSTYRDHLLLAFHEAFGRFIRQFGQTESTLSFHLEQFTLSLVGQSDLQKDVLRALIGSRRTPELANMTNLCLKAAMRAGSEHTEDAVREVAALFAQTSEIRFLRDRTAHYAIHPEWRNNKCYFRVLNRYTVNDLDKTEEILFRIEHLEFATADLETICTRLPFVLKLYDRPKPATADNPETLPPWLYKPSELIRTPYQEPRNPQ